MRRWFVIILFLAVLFLPVAARAQAGIEFEKVNIAIWPEYDRPDVLVIYHMSLSSKMSFPAEVVIRIPQVVGKPNAVAMQDADGTLVNLNFSSAPDGDWERITFSTPSPDIQIEYYDPRLTKNGAARSYEYRWPGDYAVKALSVQVQQPVGAAQMQVLPNLGSGAAGQDGLTYYASDVGELKAGTAFTIRLSYEKKDSTLSVDSQPVAPSSPITATTPGRLTMQEVLPWILGGLGLLLIGGGAFWFWQSGRDHESGKNGRRRHTGERVREEAPQSGPGVYCHQCGRRASVGDLFCRVCGTKLRV